MRSILNSVDEDYITYLAEKRDVSADVIRRAYINVRRIHKFSDGHFGALARSIHDLFSPVYGEETEASLQETHRFHAALHIYRHIGYSYWKLPRYALGVKCILAEMDASKHVTVIDYGCGLGYAAMAMYALRHCKIYLVDMDAGVLDFATWRFTRHAIPHTAIRITAADPYPAMPPHNVCLAVESMEHIREPVRAFTNIHAAMEMGGLLAGNFKDHGAQFLHISTDLSGLRAAVNAHYVAVNPKIYRKVS